MRLACQFGQPEKVISTHVLSPYLHPDHPSFLHQDHHHMNAMTCSKMYTNMSVGPVRSFYAYMSSCACMLKSGSNFVTLPPLPCSMCLPTSGIDQCMISYQFSSKGPGPRATIFRSKAAPSQPGTKNVLTYAFGHNFQHQEGNGPTWCQSLTL